MAVTVKAKSTQKSASQIIVDRIVELQKEVEAVAPQAKELAKLVADLRKQAMEQDPTEVVRFVGTDHVVTFSEAAKVRKIEDMAAAKKALGTETFMKVAKITLADIDKYLTTEESSEFIAIESGARTMKIEEK